MPVTPLYAQFLGSSTTDLTPLYRRYHDDGGWYAGAALALLGLSAWLGATRWRRQP